MFDLGKTQLARRLAAAVLRRPPKVRAASLAAMPRDLLLLANQALAATQLAGVEDTTRARIV